MGYRDRMKKPEVPNVEFKVEAEYANVVGVMSALEEDEDMPTAEDATFSAFKKADNAEVATEE